MVKHRSLIKNCERASCPLRRSCRAREGWPLSAGQLPRVLQPHSLQQAAGVFWKIMPTDRGRAGQGQGIAGSWGQVSGVVGRRRRAPWAAGGGYPSSVVWHSNRWRLLWEEGCRQRGRGQGLLSFYLDFIWYTFVLLICSNIGTTGSGVLEAPSMAVVGAPRVQAVRCLVARHLVIRMCLWGVCRKCILILHWLLTGAFKIFKSTAILHISFPIWKPEKTHFSPGCVASVPGLIFQVSAFSERQRMLEAVNESSDPVRQVWSIQTEYWQKEDIRSPNSWP